MMLAYLLIGSVLALLIVGGAFGNRALARLEPALAARPRLGLAAWLTATGVWAGLFLSLGPVLAWFGSRQLLPGPAGEVCQRCLAATNPFGQASGPLATALPAAIFVAVPLLVIMGLAARGLLTALRSQRTLRRHGRGLDIIGTRDHNVVGALRTDRVWVLPDPALAAYSIPLGRGRIVLTQGTVDALSSAELAAVIAHERAHLRQNHHAILAWTRILSQAFGWVPLMKLAAPAVAGLTEMAADDAASTTVANRLTVARALAKLQVLAQDGIRRVADASVNEPVLALSGTAPTLSSATPVLHAAQVQVPSRVRRLLEAPGST